MNNHLRPTVLISALCGLFLLAGSSMAHAPLLSTYLGGSLQEGNDDWVGFWSTLDPWGNVIVVGMTTSSDFPSTGGAYDTEYDAGYDVYVAKLSADLSTLLAATYLGSAGDEEPWGVTCDQSGNVYVSGVTTSTTFPTTLGAVQTSRSGANDAFIAKLNNNLTTLLASTYLGGAGSEGWVRPGLDSDNHVFVVGTTSSNPFPTTPGSFDNSYGGNSDFFVAKLSGDLTSLDASTYVGGTYREIWPAITIDVSGSVVISGSSGSSNYPTSEGAYDRTLNGSPGNGFENLDVVVTRLDNNLSSLLSSTYK